MTVKTGSVRPSTCSSRFKVLVSTAACFHSSAAKLQNFLKIILKDILYSLYNHFSFNTPVRGYTGFAAGTIQRVTANDLGRNWESIIKIIMDWSLIKLTLVQKKAEGGNQDNLEHRCCCFPRTDKPPTREGLYRTVSHVQHFIKKDIDKGGLRRQRLDKMIIFFFNIILFMNILNSVFIILRI